MMANTPIKEECILYEGGSFKNDKYRRLGFNCELRVFLHFAINRFANINVHVYYSTVRGRPSQLLDSQFGLT